MRKRKQVPLAKVRQVFEQIAAAGVSITDVHRMTGISRQSLQNWKSEEKPATDLIRWRLLQRLATELSSAVQRGTLPLKEQEGYVAHSCSSSRVRHRLERIKQAIRSAH
jgi:transposase-like protein